MPCTPGPYGSAATAPSPANTPASPMDTEEAGQEDQDRTVRVVSYREDRGTNNHGNRARVGTRGDRARRGDRHRDMARDEMRRDRNRRDQERAREADRRQRDRGDRANRERKGPKRT